MPDTQKVINGLKICFMQKDCDGCPYQKELKAILNKPHNDDWQCPILDDALALLKEQDAVKPYIDIDEAKCPICKVKLTRQELLGDDVLFEDFFDYCPHCGRSVKWDA